MASTWLGYAIANIWCYVLGVAAASVSEPGAPLVGALLLAQGGLIALGLIVIDEMDNAYDDVYSGSVSARSRRPRWSIGRWNLLLAVPCTGLATVLPMHSLEPFLLLLSSVLTPLYGVIPGRADMDSRRTATDRRAAATAAALWLAGIAAYHACATWTQQWGSALPTLALTFVVARLTRAGGIGAAPKIYAAG